MRYRLSTLLILLAVGPPVLAQVLLHFEFLSPMIQSLLQFIACLAISGLISELVFRLSMIVQSR